MNPHNECKSPDRQEGFVLVVMLAVLVPPIVLLGAFAATMVQRGNELGVQLEQERALFAAESGVDDAIFRGQTGTLNDGLSYTLTLGNGVSCDVRATYLKHDGIDNDGDHLIDEADEDVFQVVVTGHYRNATRKVAAYLGPVPLLPVVNSAVLYSNRAETIDLRGSVQLSGNDVGLTGVATGIQYPGMALATPGTLAELSGQLTGGERNRVVGLGGTP
ncbi:MAG TPA: hypothetical protein VK348_03295, partial [Planctomycetota bacterium]|nr:hypothetical protein [Planctomycetota bacterium]